MDFKSRLFKSPWQHKDPSVRAQAVAESDDPALKRELGRLAEHDESAEVRLAALRRINTEAFWLDARLRESDAAIVESADAYLSRAVMRAANPDMIKERLEWFARIDDAEWIRNAARHAPDDSLRAAALERIDAQGFLGDCYIAEPSDQIAASLLERIAQASTLERILESLRRTSKKRARAVELRLADLSAESGSGEAASTIALRLVEQAEALSRGEFKGDRAASLARLEEQWQALKGAPDPLQRRFQGAAAIVRRSLEVEVRRDNEATPSEGEPAEPAAEPHPDLQALARRIQQTVRDRAADPGPLLSDWDRAWNAVQPPSAADEALREALLPQLRDLQKQHEADAHKPAPDPDNARPQTDFAPALDQVGKVLEQGDIAAAHEALRRLRSEFDRLPTRSRPRQTAGRLQRMEGRLKEMRNWQHWSNNKIRDQLIEQVERLAESDQHPDAVTSALKAARTEWQRLESLEVLPGDKRRFAAPPGQWRRFQAACKQAFEMARPFFEKRHEVKEQNLAVLQAFVDKGLKLADEEAPASQELLAFMRKARQAIRRLDDVPPKARGQAAGRLKKLMNRLSERLDQAYEQIELTKRRLIAEARELAYEKDLPTAIARAKDLQSRWQAAGNGRRRVEQKLWLEFREPIDPLFEKLREDRQEQQQVEQETVEELTSLCEQAEALASLPEAELPGAAGRLRGIRDEWHARLRRPHNLNKRFARAEETFHQRLAEIRERERTRAAEALTALAAQVQKAWQQRLSEGEATAVETVAADTDDPLHSELVQRLSSIADPGIETAELERQVRDNVEKARQVVVEMEFLAGVETPEADRKRRMNYQVQRLARRLSERDRQPDLESELEALVLRWYRALPLPDQQHDELAMRFEKCQNVIESMIGK